MATFTCSAAVLVAVLATLGAIPNARSDARDAAQQPRPSAQVYFVHNENDAVVVVFHKHRSTKLATGGFHLLASTEENTCQTTNFVNITVHDSKVRCVFQNPNAVTKPLSVTYQITRCPVPVGLRPGHTTATVAFDGVLATPPITVPVAQRSLFPTRDNGRLHRNHPHDALHGGTRPPAAHNSAPRHRGRARGNTSKTTMTTTSITSMTSTTSSTAASTATPLANGRSARDGNGSEPSMKGPGLEKGVKPVRESPARASTLAAKAQPQYHLCACLLLWYRSQFLEEWLRYHTAVHGLEKAFLYDNDSGVDGLPLHVRHLGLFFNIEYTRFPTRHAQPGYTGHCILRARRQCGWVMLMDVDEYLTLHSKDGSDPRRSLSVFLTSQPPHVGQVKFLMHSYSSGRLLLQHPEAVPAAHTYRCHVKTANKLYANVKAVLRPTHVHPSLYNTIHRVCMKANTTSITMYPRQGLLRHLKVMAWNVYRRRYQRRASPASAGAYENQHLSATAGLTEQYRQDALAPCINESILPHVLACAISPLATKLCPHKAPFVRHPILAAAAKNPFLSNAAGEKVARGRRRTKPSVTTEVRVVVLGRRRVVRQLQETARRAHSSDAREHRSRRERSVNGSRMKEANSKSKKKSTNNSSSSHSTSNSTSSNNNKYNHNIYHGDIGGFVSSSEPPIQVSFRSWLSALQPTAARVPHMLLLMEHPLLVLQDLVNATQVRLQLPPVLVGGALGRDGTASAAPVSQTHAGSLQNRGYVHAVDANNRSSSSSSSSSSRDRWTCVERRWLRRVLAAVAPGEPIDAMGTLARLVPQSTTGPGEAELWNAVPATTAEERAMGLFVVVGNAWHAVALASDSRMPMVHVDSLAPHTVCLNRLRRSGAGSFGEQALTAICAALAKGSDSNTVTATRNTTARGTSSTSSAAVSDELAVLDADQMCHMFAVVAANNPMLLRSFFLTSQGLGFPDMYSFVTALCP